MSTKLEMSEDAVTVAALAGTALAYAGSVGDEVERWLRALSEYGEAGMTLAAMGLTDSRPPGDDTGPQSTPEDAEARLAAVLTSAEEFALRRGVELVGTTDLLLGVMRVYGESFDQALTVRETNRAELVECLESERRIEALG